jgi:hypothetical protein
LTRNSPKEKKEKEEKEKSHELLLQAILPLTHQLGYATILW